MSKTQLIKLSALLIAAVTVTLGQEHGDGNSGQFKADLNGYNEVPSVVTTGSGDASVVVSPDQQSLSITVNFTKLAGTAQSAGLYLALPSNTGGLIAPVCGAPQPACPTTADGSVTVTIMSADVVAIAAQGLAAGDLASVIQAMSNGAVYVNIITTDFANGEIRGQLRRGYNFGHDGGGRGH